MDQTPAAAYLTDSYVFKWQNQTFVSDLIYAAPVALCLGMGLAVGHPMAGMIAAGGAATVGFGAKQTIDSSRLLPMIFATLGIAFSTFVGMVAGHDNVMLVVVAALWAFGYGLLTERPDGYGWVGQQCVVTLLVGSAFPFSARLAVVRALLLGSGGAVQVIWSSAALRLFGQLKTHLVEITRYMREEEAELRATVMEIIRTVRRGRFVDSELGYPLRLLVVVGLSTEIYRELHFSSGYWIPMTALLVLKPGLTDTASRAIARTLGTVAAAWVLSILVARYTPSPWELVLITVIFAWLSFATQNVNYALFAFFVTGYIVFLLAFTRIPQATIAERRAICTALGGALALTVRLVVIRTRKRRDSTVSDLRLGPAR
jgi:Fusaric acid resistance protein-like